MKMLGFVDDKKHYANNVLRTMNKYLIVVMKNQFVSGMNSGHLLVEE